MDYRYQSIDYTGNILKTGNLLRDIEGLGERILIDYKIKRYTLQPTYPATRYTWHQGFDGISRMIKK